MGVCDNIVSMTINGDNETTGVTTFSSEACEAVDVLSGHRVPPPSLGVSSNSQDLKEYFRRPQVIASGTVPNGTRALISSFVCDANNIFTTAFPGGFLRLNGALGVRFDMVFTVQLAATPFHQGVFCSSFQYGHNSPTSTTANFARCSLSATATNLPHVRLDVSVDTMSVLRVPFLMPAEFMPLSGLVGGPLTVIGVFAFNQLLPTPTVTGIAPMPYKIMMHLENLELVGAVPFVTAGVTPQSGGAGPLTQEFEQQAYPFSSGLSSLGRTLKWVSRGVPALSSLTSTPIWLAGKAAGALRSFGFSKPLIQEPIRRVLQYSTAMENNVDVATTAVALGPFASNAITMGPQVATSSVDEMALDYVLSQWSQICIGQITNAQPVGTTVYAAAVSPSCCWFRSAPGPIFGNINQPLSATATTNSFIPSTVFSISSMFASYRGSLEYRITFSKTKLHGGRVLLTYVPNADHGVLAPGTNTAVSAPGAGPNGFISPTGITTVFDLRDDNVVSFDCPYMSPLSNLTFNQGFGSLTMIIHDPLVGPATVATSIGFMVEVRAKPGFDLITPKGPSYPAIPAGTVVVQSGGLMKMSDTTFRETITSAGIQDAVGESITSLKQIIMLPHVTREITVPSGQTNFMWCPPWYHSNSYPSAVPFGGTFLVDTFNSGGYIAQHYAFVSGGTDYYFYTFQDGVMSWAQISGNDWNAFNDSNTVNNGPGSSANRIFAVGHIPLHFKVPAYQRTKRCNPATLREIPWTGIFGAGGNPTLLTGNSNIIPPVAAKIYCQNISATASFGFLQRSASDDARAGLYMGPVPLLLPTTVVGSGSFYDLDSIGFQ